MLFDNLPEKFDTITQKKIWWRGRTLTPTQNSLTEKVRAEMGAELTESCVQMRAFFLELYTDIYENYALFNEITVKFYMEIIRKMIAIRLKSIDSPPVTKPEHLDWCEST